MFTEEIQLVLSKTQKRTVSADRVNKQVAGIKEVVTPSRQVKGFSLVPNYIGPEAPDSAAAKHAGDNGLMAWNIVGDPKAGYEFELYLTLRYQSDGNVEPDRKIVESILNGIADVAAKPTMGLWTLATVNGQEWEPFDPTEVGKIEDEGLEYAPVKLPPNLAEILNQDMYGLEDHVSRMVAAVEAGVYSNFDDRCHMVLVGPPGCGKTTLVEKLEAALGTDCFVTFDRTATTGAGAIKELDDVEILPRFMFIDEGEKTTDTASNFMLSLLDDRAEIHKVTARKKIQRQIKLVGIACVNDEEDWNKLCKGALADRFGEPIYFSPPDDAMLRRICEREVAKVPGGSDAWIEPCLKYCLSRGWRKPRKIISLLKQGRDRWLDAGPSGFAAILTRTTKPSEIIPATDWSNKK